MQVFTRVIGGSKWWYTPVIPGFGRLGQEDHEFKACLGYIRRLDPRTDKTKNNNQKQNKTTTKTNPEKIKEQPNTVMQGQA